MSFDSLFEGDRYSGAKHEVFDHSSRGVGDVKEDLDHVTLLAIIFFVFITINNQVRATGNINIDIVEEAAVLWIGQDTVPGDALD